MSVCRKNGSQQYMFSDYLYGSRPDCEDQPRAVLQHYSNGWWWDWRGKDELCKVDLFETISQPVPSHIIYKASLNADGARSVLLAWI